MHILFVHSFCMVMLGGFACRSDFASVAIPWTRRKHVFGCRNVGPFECAPFMFRFRVHWDHSFCVLGSPPTCRMLYPHLPSRVLRSALPSFGFAVEFPCMSCRSLKSRCLGLVGPLWASTMLTPPCIEFDRMAVLSSGVSPSRAFFAYP